MSLNINKLSEQFNIKFISYTQIYQGVDNNVFMLTDENNKKYILRMVLRNKPVEDLMFEKNFSDYLLKHKIPVRKIISFGTNTLLTFCDGKTLNINEITPQQAFNGGQTLAKFHQVSADFCTDFLPNRRPESELQRALSMRDKLMRKYTNGAEFIDNVEKLLNSQFLNSGNHTIIHNDFRIQNVLFDGDNISAILDFDWSCQGNPLKDLAHSMIEWSYPDGGNFNPKIFNSFFHGYTNDGKHININELKYWLNFGCISDTATYLCDIIDEPGTDGPILSWMYGKISFLNTQDIAQLTE